MNHLFVRRVFLSPTEIVFYRSAEKHVFLKNDRNAFSQRVEIVIANVGIADHNAPLRYVVKPRNKVDERCFRRSRSAEYADGLPRFYIEIDIFERVFFCFGRIFEAYVFKPYIAVFNVHYGICGIDDIAFLVQYFYNSSSRFERHDYHDEYHRDHHKRHENLKRISR